jgi:hypothetical protein
LALRTLQNVASVTDVAPLPCVVWRTEVQGDAASVGAQMIPVVPSPFAVTDTSRKSPVARFAGRATVIDERASVSATVCPTQPALDPDVAAAVPLAKPGAGGEASSEAPVALDEPAWLKFGEEFGVTDVAPVPKNRTIRSFALFTVTDGALGAALLPVPPFETSIGFVGSTPE